MPSSIHDFNGGLIKAVEVGIYVSNYILPKTVNMITYACPNLN